MLQDRYRDDGLVVIGLNAGGLGGGERPEHVVAFLEQTGIQFDVVWDEGSYRAFSWPPAISPFPRQVLIDADGRVVFLASEYQGDALDSAIRETLAR